ncbi:MAG: aldolase/citrate lyase family protein [Limnobacter sp.]|nr:aldolase/citrate lyase family protein [Limnobacter sp.]
MKKPPLDLTKIASILFSEADKPVVLPVCDHYAGNPKFFEKALNIRGEMGACFDITLDLEDGAKVGQEAEAVKWAAQALVHFVGLNGAENRRPGVRIHPLKSSVFEMELDTLLQEGVPTPAYLMLPKPEQASDVREASARIFEVANKNGVSAPPLHVLIETHGALAEVHAIAGLQEVESLSFGIMDFLSGHRGAIPKSALNTPGQFENPLIKRAKLEIAAACHRFGKVPSHNVCRNVTDPEAAGEDAHRAKRDFGYTRMWSIHPAQIVHIVSALLPSDKEYAEAVEVLTAANAADWGPIQIKGELHDRASYRYFWEMIKKR